MADPTQPAGPVKKNPRAAKPPAFQFYAADWLADANVRAMSPAERGWYIDLLAYSWREHGLPADPEEVRRLIGDARACIWKRARARLLSRFRTDLTCACGCGANNRLRNPRLEEQRKEQIEFAQRMAAKGRAGAAARWDGPGNARANARANAQALPADGSASASALESVSASEETLDLVALSNAALLAERTAAQGFAAFWAAYPRKRAKKDAVKAWKALKAGPGLLAVILDRLAAHRAEWDRRGEPDKVPYPATWIRGERWDDIPDPPPTPRLNPGEEAWQRERARFLAPVPERTPSPGFVPIAQALDPEWEADKRDFLAGIVRQIRPDGKS